VSRLRPLSFALLALVLAASATLAACSNLAGNAMTVNGSSLSNSQFNDWLKKLTDAKAAPALASKSSSTYSTNLTTTVLNQYVAFALVQSELDRRHITLTSSDLTAAEQQADSEFAPQTTDPSTGQPVAGDPSQGKATLDKLGSFKTQFVKYVAGQTALEKIYAKQRGSDAALRKLFDQNRSQFTNKACVNALEVPAQPSSTDPTDQTGAPTPSAAEMATALQQANQIRSQAKTGDEFISAAASMAQQEGATNGGDLGCSAKGNYATQLPELDSAIWSLPVGEVSQPIKVSSGYLLVRVRARGDLTFEDVKDQLQQAAAQQSVTDFQDWLTKAEGKASVSVDPQWGSWNSRTRVVVAPVGASSTTTTPKRRSTSTSSTSSTTSSTTP
jgi:foldase protein PrsA